MMKMSKFHFTAAAGLLLSLLPIPAALAQDYGGAPPPPPRPPMQGGPAPSAANTPLPMLVSALKLTDDQKARIDAIQKSFDQARRGLMPSPPQAPPPPDAPPPPRGGGDSAGDAGGPPPPPPPGAAPPPPPMPPDPEVMDEVKSMDQAASAKIEAVLTSSQRAELPAVLKQIDALRAAGIPPRVMAQLDLTAEQRARIADLVSRQRSATKTLIQQARASGDYSSVGDALRDSRRKLRAEVMDVLTADQRAMVQRARPAGQRDARRPGPRGRAQGFDRNGPPRPPSRGGDDGPGAGPPPAGRDGDSEADAPPPPGAPGGGGPSLDPGDY